MRKEFQDHNSIDAEIFCDECGGDGCKIYQHKGQDLCDDCCPYCTFCGNPVTDDNEMQYFSDREMCRECMEAETEENNLMNARHNAY